jgi:uncharacterized damage-inducible protein DinB
MKPHFAMMARYNAWANARLYAEAHAVSDESYRKDVGAFFRSLHGTLNHLLVTDRIWMRRFTGKASIPLSSTQSCLDDLPSLEAARRAEDARIIQYVEGISEEEIGRDFSYSTTKGVPQQFILPDLLAHWFNHRGQAHCILTVVGVPEPKPLDLGNVSQGALWTSGNQCLTLGRTGGRPAQCVIGLRRDLSRKS